MDPIFLTFNNPAVERDYDAHVANSGGLAVDALIFRILSVIPVFGLIRFVRLGMSPLLIAAALANLVYNGGVLIWISRATFEQLAGARTPVIVVARVVGLIFQICGAVFDHAIPADLVGFLMRSSIMPTLILAYNMRLKFKYHLPCHIATTLATVYFTTRGACQTVLNADENHATVPIAQFLDLVAKRVMATYGVAVSETSVPHPCLHASAWALIFVVLVGGSCTLWIKERNSRIAFIKCGSNKRVDNDQGLGELRDCISEVPVWIILCHLGMITVCFAATWKWTYAIVELVDSWAL